MRFKKLRRECMEEGKDVESKDQKKEKRNHVVDLYRQRIRMSRGHLLSFSSVLRVFLVL